MIQSGTKLAHFEIVSALGKGGMGEVWRARDTKLGREVAIKTLPSEFAQDRDRLARFGREAKLLASLNHANIAAVHGFEEDAGTHFLVMELVEGETLADRTARGAIPVDESLKIALQIAEALEAAHENGVIHRDLKPANIKVTADGTAKVLDFGLAKALAGGESEVNAANSPTLSMQATQQGLILGTAAYMSPEQAKGRPVDKRADIWAFGCVLYELLTGRQVFRAEDVSTILARVLEREPDYTTLPENLHPRLRELLERCLDKNVATRYRDIGDVRVDIQKVLGDPGGGIVDPVAGFGTSVEAPPKPKLAWLAASVGLAVLIGVIAGVGGWILKPSDPRPVVRFTVPIPEDQTPEPVLPVMDISPDGRYLAYVGSGNNQIYLHSLEDDRVRVIQGTTAGLKGAPTFSPDGAWLAYAFNANTMMKIPVNGGSPQLIAEVQQSQLEMTWDDRDMIVFTQAAGVFQVSADGGSPELVIPAMGGETLSAASLLPDGDSILFTSTTADGQNRWDAGQIFVYSLASQNRKLIHSGGGDARYVPTGHLVYAQGTNLVAVGFDLDRLEVRDGTPVLLVDGVVRAGATHISSANYAVSDSGILASLAGGGSVGTLLGFFATAEAGRLVAGGPDGNVEVITDQVRSYQNPRISPDGTRIAVAVSQGGATHVWIVDVATGIGEQLTFEHNINVGPVWTPDGESVVFASLGDGDSVTTLFRQDADGETAAVPLYEHDGFVVPTDLSSDGVLVFISGAAAGNGDIWTVDITDPESAEPFLATTSNEYGARFSSDGRWLTYVSNQAGEDRVFVRPYPSAGGGQTQVFDGLMFAPVWGDDGLLYSFRIQTEPEIRGGLVTTAVRTGTEFSIAGRPEPWSEEPPDLGLGAYELGIAPYDVMTDGERLLWVSREGSTEGDEGTPASINVVLNWTSELLERVPVD